jgi:hypothetical protein
MGFTSGTASPRPLLSLDELSLVLDYIFGALKVGYFRAYSEEVENVAP